VPNLSQNRQSPELIALGSAIKKCRLEKDISQEHLALLAGIDRSYLGRVERGDNNAAALTLIKICSALGMTLEQLAAEAQL
jgi:transcriptional regulator with XRE-family HTH domain